MLDLPALLRALEPADAREADFKARMLALYEQGGDPFSRDHFVPGHFTASAFVVSPERDGVLLIHHRKLGLWLQPGGHFDPEDESVLSAARREIAEETGLRDLPLAVEGLLDVDIHEIPPLKADPAHLHLDLRFAFQAQSRDFQADLAEVKGARWFDFDEVSYAWSDASVMRAVGKLRERMG
ncbi:MAG: NUDIX hydrolase [Alphaproteobacteria bacterium]|nr:NUDIX hydrolase [Alphaproteobacteria bacterium]MCB9794425.1 NUDIX hydrolase [Alphaproteobacteria bacterium]